MAAGTEALLLVDWPTVTYEDFGVMVRGLAEAS